MSENVSSLAIDTAKRMWAETGPLASVVRFRALIEPGTNPVLILMVDADGIGRKQSMLVRCVRIVPLSEVHERLKDTIAALYRNTSESIQEAATIGVRF